MTLTPQDLVGKSIVAIKGFEPDRRKSKKHIGVDYILLDDGKTIIEFEEQDLYTYHDCDIGARRILVKKSEKTWDVIMKNKDDRYPDATEWL